jgi:hypothetical protein
MKAVEGGETVCHLGCFLFVYLNSIRTGSSALRPPIRAPCTAAQPGVVGATRPRFRRIACAVCRAAPHVSNACARSHPSARRHSSTLLQACAREQPPNHARPRPSSSSRPCGEPHRAAGHHAVPKRGHALHTCPARQFFVGKYSNYSVSSRLSFVSVLQKVLHTDFKSVGHLRVVPV